jgi:hypothetical protein
LQQLLFVAGRGLPMGIDAAIFIFSVSDFLNPLMRDDGILPAYVDTPSGDLAIGRAYRKRRSHVLAEGPIGRAFFWAVDHSLVLDFIYVKAKLGFFQSPPEAGAPSRLVDRCAASRDNLSNLDKLFGAGEPQWAARRLDRFLADVPKLLNGKPAVFVLGAYGMPDAACSAEKDLRTRVVKQSRAKVEAAGIGFVDLDMAVLGKTKDEKDYKALHGFGVRIGGGHLNPGGHEVYSQVLTDVVVAHLPALKQKGASR